jgi:hypothetical protein
MPFRAILKQRREAGRLKVLVVGERFRYPKPAHHRKEI